MQKSNKVWIIDDDRSIRWVLEKALQGANIETRVFDSGDSAMNQLNRDTPDAIISDIRMPGTDGLTLLGNLHNTHPQIPIIIMTAHSDLDSAVAAYQGGAFEYLPKPFDVDDAVAVLSAPSPMRRSKKPNTAPKPRWKPIPKSSAKRRRCRKCFARLAACRNPTSLC